MRPLVAASRSCASLMAGQIVQAVDGKDSAPMHCVQVVSDRANKSILVAIDRWQWLPKFKKEIKRTTKLMAHDENNECRVGDLVQVESSR